MKPFSKNSLIPLLFSLAFLLACTPKDESPNIIYILADDLGYGDLSCYNEDSQIKTPHLDALAQEGIRYTDAHTSSSVCTPTRYGILTGRYNWRSELKSGVLTGKSKALIPSSRTTVASLLKDHGYHTAFLGKWHLGWDWAVKDSLAERGEGWDARDFDNLDFSKKIQNGPHELGFDYSFGFSGSLDMAPYVYVENSMPTMLPDSTSVNRSTYGWWREGPTSADFDHEDVTPLLFRKAKKYIKERKGSKDPFFLYLALPSPHTPILPTKEWIGKSQLNPYGDFVMMIDDQVGQLLNILDQAGMKENTLVIFTSDNGCSPAAKINIMQEKGHYPSYIFRGHKADIFEGGHRVPFILRWPDRVEKNQILDKIICTTDLMASCADLIGYELQADEGEDSYSFMPLLTKEKNRTESREAIVHHSINGSFSIRQGDWKLILCPGSGGWSYPRPNDQEVIDSLPPYQLYNLSEDPGESNNLINAEEEKAMQLKKLLAQIILDGRSTAGLKQANDPIDKEWKQIRFLEEE
jgi:arylsulfatase A-like enzyme